jgi:hypothetical protein
MINYNTGTVPSSEMWYPMTFVTAQEVGETIEMLYTQTSKLSRTGGLPPYQDERAIKIVYSCVDGKWNKSDPIYGNIIPAQGEYFKFEK